MDKNQDFTSGNITSKLVKFMFPILGALILQAMYSAVDLMIVGWFGTTEGVSGVSTGSSCMNLLTFTVCALTTGVTVLMGQYIGEGRKEKIDALLGGAIAFFAVVALVVSVLVIIFARQFAYLMQAPDEAVELTTSYIRICGAGYIFIVFYNFISAIFRGIGDSKMPLIFVGIACIVNIGGDLLLVAGLGMDASGAAIATVAAQAVSVILSIVIILRKKGLPFRLNIKNIRFNAYIGKFLKVGLPLALQEVLTNITFMAVCAFVNRLGLDASSGYGVAQKIQSFVMLIPSSIMQSMSSFVAQNVGAGKEDRARKAMLTGMGIGAIIGAAVFLVVFFWGNYLAMIFTKDAAVIARAFEFLRGFAIEAVVTAVLFSFMGYFNGHSQSFFVMVQGLAQSFLVRLPVSYIMSIQPNASLTWIGIAAPSATVFGIVINFIYYKYYRKKYILPVDKKAEIVAK